MVLAVEADFEAAEGFEQAPRLGEGGEGGDGVGGGMVLAVEGDFEAAEGFEQARRLVEGVEGDDGLGGRVFVDDPVALEPLFAADLGGPEGPAAEDAPAAEGHGFGRGFYSGELVGGGGVELGGEVSGEWLF